MRKVTKHVALVITICFISLTCSEPLTPPPTKTMPLKLRGASTEMKSLAPSEAFLSATGGSSVTVASYPFTEGVIVDVKIEGLIDLQSDSRAWPIHYSGGLDYNGISVPTTSCYLRAYVSFSSIPGPGTTFGGYNNCSIPRAMTDYSMQVRVGGTATAHRGPLPYSNYCDGPCTYTATGSQRITITPLEADLDFKATFGGARKDHFFLPPFVSYYQMIFTDSTFPRGMPRGNFNHTWTRADPTYPGHPYWKLTENTCYAGNLYCAVNIKETGIMTSTTRVNGVVHTDSVTIYCADSLPELNNDLVRQGLMAVLDSSGAGIDSTTSIYARNERGFFILQDTTVPGSKPFIWLLPEKPHADACQYGGKFPEFSERPAGTLVLGWGHSHPGVRWENVMCTDTLGNPRTFWQNGELKVWTSDLTPGVSTSDFEEQQRRNDPNYPQYQGPIDEYFIQSDGTLLILRPGQLPMAPYNLPSQNIRWRTGRCAWPRRTI